MHLKIKLSVFFEKNIYCYNWTWVRETQYLFLYMHNIVNFIWNNISIILRQSSV